jgi:hypothetical protein
MNKEKKDFTSFHSKLVSSRTQTRTNFAVTVGEEESLYTVSGRKFG